MTWWSPCSHWPNPLQELSLQAHFVAAPPSAAGELHNRPWSIWLGAQGPQEEAEEQDGTMTCHSPTSLLGLGSMEQRS